MIPSRDRIGQIRSYTRWLQNRLGATIRGLWVPERVWEQSFTRDLVDAGIEYTVLDDFHFKCAGLADSQLTGHCADRRRGPHALGVPRQRAAPLPDSVRRPAADDRLSGQTCRAASQRGGGFRRRRREVRHLAGNAKARLRRRLAGAVLRRPGAEPELDPGDHAGRGVRQRAAGGQGLSARLQLPRDDRMGAAGRAADRIRADRARDARRSALAVAAAVHARRVLAELQGEVSRSRRNVLPHDDGQPAVAGDARRRPPPAIRSTPNWSSRPAPNSIAASAIAAIGTGRSAASICRTCATPSIST